VFEFENDMIYNDMIRYDLNSITKIWLQGRFERLTKGRANIDVEQSQYETSSEGGRGERVTVLSIAAHLWKV
jgi:hypothetical protein